MAAEHRRVLAQSIQHAQALAENLIASGFVIEQQTPTEWFLRKRRKRLGDITTTIGIGQRPADPWAPPPVPTGPPPSPPQPWGPPR